MLSDRSQDIRASVSDVETTLVITVILVVLIIFAFLRKVWATAIPSVTVPLSIIATFGVMYLFGYSLDNLSLMALTIAVGFVVDDAIVMIENIVRYIEAGDNAFDAALKGAGQIGFTIISITFSLDRRVHPVALHVRDRRPAVPRVRHDSEHCCCGVRLYRTHSDADDVLAVPQPRERSAERTH